MIDPVSRLPDQWKGSPLVQGLVAALALPADGIMDALADLVTAYQIDTAIGVQLDALGLLLGLPRESRDDDTYRAWLRAQDYVLRSRGRPDDLLKILELVAPGATYEYSEDTGTVYLVAYPVTDVQTIGHILNRAKAAGVRLEFSGSTSTDLFMFDTGSGFDVGVWADLFVSP